ncbi:MAG: thioredoxin domain-containing protein [Bacteriovorax sp.]|nr:thioredoxin domain-containing protein [Bacteriovorax sp.]
MKKNKKIALKNQLNRELKIILGSFFAIVVIAIVFYFTNQNNKLNENINPTKQDNLTRDFNHKKGPENAKVKIVEFYDPECEACAAFSPYVKEIISRYQNDIQLTVRYALYHGNSTLAAKASDAAALQGKFWDFQELLFLNQSEWSHSQVPAIENFIKYAKDLDLDVLKFQTDINDLKRMETISIDLEDGKKLGVNGTPTIFINGKKLENLHPNSFKEKIEEEISKTN